MENTSIDGEDPSLRTADVVKAYRHYREHKYDTFVYNSYYELTAREIEVTDTE